jgi:hypothetical protein
MRAFSLDLEAKGAHQDFLTMEKEALEGTGDLEPILAPR